MAQALNRFQQPQGYSSARPFGRHALGAAPHPPRNTRPYNSPQSVLCVCSGQVTPDGALLLASLIYIAVLCLACLLPSPALRGIVAASSAITVAYTPILKRVTALKNLAVAFIIAASPLSGALAVAVPPSPLLDAPHMCSRTPVPVCPASEPELPSEPLSVDSVMCRWDSFGVPSGRGVVQGAHAILSQALSCAHLTNPSPSRSWELPSRLNANN